MRRTILGSVVVLLSIVTLLSVGSGQEARSLTLQETGRIVLKDAQGDLGILELNLHNSNWRYASQAQATAKCEEQAGGGKTFTGTLGVPDVPGAEISFMETVTKGEDGVHVTYELKPTAPVILNGLQISLLLPAGRFAGQQLVIKSQEAAERSLVLPAILNAEEWQLGTVQSKSVQIGADAAAAITLGIDKTYGLIFHDLRRWERNEFEIRIPLVQEQQGKMIGANDRYAVEVILGPAGFEVTGP